MLPTDTSHTPPRTGPTDGALSAAYAALAEAPASRVWWLRPAHRAQLVKAVAHRVENHVLQEAAATAVDRQLDLPQFLSLAQCPKCARIFDQGWAPRAVYTTETLEATKVEYMSCRCVCGYRWREQCADAQTRAPGRLDVPQAWFAAAVVTGPAEHWNAPNPALGPAPARLPAAASGVQAIVAADPGLPADTARTIPQAPQGPQDLQTAPDPWAGAPDQSDPVGLNTTGRHAAVTAGEPDRAPWARTATPTLDPAAAAADEAPLYGDTGIHRGWVFPTAGADPDTQFAGTVYDPQAEHPYRTY